MKSFFVIFMLIFGATCLTGCVHKLVTVPTKVAYKTTKGVVKGTTAVVKAVVPDGDDDDADGGKKDKKHKKDEK
ncbi:MAG: NF038104 family lipoprotein [Moraxella sp.]|nr:NF038104 family lipoprotein [Moraxella sp.]